MRYLPTKEKQQMGEGGDKWGQTTTHAIRQECNQGRHAHNAKNKCIHNTITHMHTHKRGITLSQISPQILQSSKLIIKSNRKKNYAMHAK